jgi:metallo-beta-lactamase family protein
MNTTGVEQPSIQFLGAAGTVTGSRFLLEFQGTRVLVDCGMFQGLKELRLKNWAEFAVEPESIDAVVLTHAHLDHCGYLPRLVKLGYRGPVYLTEYTGKLGEVIMRDSARIQTEDAAWAAKKGFSKHNPPVALYGEADVDQALTQFQPTDFYKRTQVATETFVTFHPAGHILGASFVEVEFFGKRLLFTGDLGRPDHPLLRAPGVFPEGQFDAVVTESTYGDRVHEGRSDDFQTVINMTIDRGGSVLIPAFAVDRTEVILVRLRELVETGKVRNVPIYADSPMALKALAFYRDAIDKHSPEIRDDIAETWHGRDPFDPGTLVELMTVDESKSINTPPQPSIIISASGMATGGRVVHHLRSMLTNPKDSVILVGYQAVGTRGRNLVEGAKEVKMHGEMVEVKAQIASVQEFSVHVDGNELMKWLEVAKSRIKRVFVIHGEEGAQDTVVQRIEREFSIDAVAPTDASRFQL